MTVILLESNLLTVKFKQFDIFAVGNAKKNSFKWTDKPTSPICFIIEWSFCSCFKDGSGHTFGIWGLELMESN